MSNMDQFTTSSVTGDGTKNNTAPRPSNVSGSSGSTAGSNSGGSAKIGAFKGVANSASLPSKPKIDTNKSGPGKNAALGSNNPTNEAIKDMIQNDESTIGKSADGEETNKKRPRISLDGSGVYDGNNTTKRQSAASAKRGEKGTLDTNSSQNQENASSQYIALPFHGDHRRAVSAVSFAPIPTLASRGSLGNTSLNDTPRNNTVMAMCASSSADGSAKIWEITGSMMEMASDPFYRKSLMKDDASSTTTETVGGGDKELQSSTTPAASSTISEFSPVSRLLNPKVTLLGHNRGINDVTFSPTAAYVATASDDKTLRLWDVVTGDALVEMRGHQNFVFSCKFNPQSNLLVSGSFDETVKLWDIRTGSCVSTLPAHSDPVTGVDFNRDGTCIVSGSHDGLIRVWDTATGECLKTVYAEGNPPVCSVRFSPNGKFVLAGTLDSKLRLWDVTGRHGRTGDTSAFRHMNNRVTPTGGKCSKTYAGHENKRFCAFATFASVNPFRQCVVSGSEDGKVYLYDLQRRLVRQTLEGHCDAVLAVASHDNLELIASGGMTNDKTVRFWSPAGAS